MAQTVGHGGGGSQDLFHGPLLTEAFQIDFANWINIMTADITAWQ